MDSDKLKVPPAAIRAVEREIARLQARLATLDAKHAHKTAPLVKRCDELFETLARMEASES